MSSANPTQDTGLSHYLSATMLTFQVSSHPHSHCTPHFLAREVLQFRDLGLIHILRRLVASGCGCLGQGMGHS